jgi:hypothetical protein
MSMTYDPTKTRSLIDRDANGILRGIHICTTWAAVDAWIERLSKVGCNYFVRFLDTHGPALQFSRASWVAEGGRYINR